MTEHYQAVREYMAESLPGYVDREGIDTQSLVESTLLEFGLSKDGDIPPYLFDWARELVALYEANHPSLLWAESFLKEGG